MKLPNPDPILNAKRFRLLALKNLERARFAKSVPERRHHRTLAKHYMFMTESELEAAEQTGGIAIVSPFESDRALLRFSSR